MRKISMIIAMLMLAGTFGGEHKPNSSAGYANRNTSNGKTDYY
jgi:hypothetical protein